MLGRTVHVKDTKVNNVIINSVFQVGDMNFLDSFSNALAVKEKVIAYTGNEDEDFSRFRIFSMPASVPVIYENFPIYKNDLIPKLQVGCHYTNSVSTSSAFVIGNIGHVRMTSRVHHIRKLTQMEQEAYQQQTEGG